MSDTLPADINSTLVQLGQTDCEPFFRAINTPVGRRALKLERPFWTVLEAVCKVENVSMGELIYFIETASLTGKNLASAVRLFALEWTVLENQKMKAKLSSAAFSGLLEASASPAFSISPRKALHSYNRAFLKFIRQNLPGPQTEFIGASLRLQLDLGLDEIIQKLASNDGKPVMVGFAIGVDERRIRGKVNAIQAPFWPGNMLLGFVVD